jgi:hypothetical protein
MAVDRTALPWYRPIGHAKAMLGPARLLCRSLQTLSGPSLKGKKDDQLATKQKQPDTRKKNV